MDEIEGVNDVMALDVIKEIAANSFNVNDRTGIITGLDELMDVFQEALATHKPVQCPLNHLFTPGLYIRQIFMPAKTESDGEEVETVVISKIHKTTHPYAILSGKVAVYNKADGFLGMVETGHVGVTLPGTRRILHVLESCRWVTFHPLSYITGEENEWPEEEKEALLKRIENDLIETREIRKEGTLSAS